MLFLNQNLTLSALYYRSHEWMMATVAIFFAYMPTNCSPLFLPNVCAYASNSICLAAAVTKITVSPLVDLN